MLKKKETKILNTKSANKRTNLQTKVTCKNRKEETEENEDYTLFISIIRKRIV